MTDNRRAAKVRAIRWMKGVLVAGSVAASLLGTQLLAERAAVETPPAAVLPAQSAQGPAWQQAPSRPELELGPVPTAAAPLRPVARSRSSR